MKRERTRILETQAFPDRCVLGTSFRGKPRRGRSSRIMAARRLSPVHRLREQPLRNRLLRPFGTGISPQRFTPACEGDLSGHATLVSAHVLFRHLGYPGNSLVFDTRSGDLIVEEKNGLLVMDFPDGSNEIRRACDGKKDSVSCEMDGSPKRFFTCSSSSCETLQIPVRHQRNEDPGRRNRE